MSVSTGHALETEGISKLFGNVAALADVDFAVHRGKVNALVGENGAGKSTLMSILAGIFEPSSGQVLIDGEPVRLSSPRAAAAHGIRLIPQELLLFENLSVAENMFAGVELQSRWGVRLREQERRAEALLERLGQPISPGAPVGELPVGLQQVVAICRALAQDANVLIMDEPTSALSEREVGQLLALVRSLADDGMAVIYISHRLEEVMQLGDTVTVLRDGRLVDKADVDSISVRWIVERMIGYDPEEMFPHRPRPTGDVVLEVENLTLPRDEGGLLLDRVGLSVAAGEIVGLYGLMGAGRTELLESLIGLHEDAVGRVVLGRDRLDGRSTGERIHRGMFLVPEDRQREGLVQVLSVRENVSMASLDSLGGPLGFSPAHETTAVKRSVTQARVKVADIDLPVTALSGGNQQKVVVARALLTEPRLLLMDDPMRGIDVGAKTELYKLMQALAEQGLAILFTSSDLTEVLGMADRILVMARGAITREFARDEATSDALVDASNPAAKGGAVR